MFELGQESDQEHAQIVDRAAADPTVQFIFAGPDFSKHRQRFPSALFFSTFNELSEFLGNHKFTLATILIKGSRGMALERVLDLI